MPYLDSADSRLFSFAEPMARNDCGYHEDKSCFPTISTTELPGKAEECSIPGPQLATFHAFGNLPPELRIKIWHESFLPRVVELHPTRPNDADAVRDGGGYQQQQWQSGCSNPAALSVCAEAREIALEHFRIAYPLTSVTTQPKTKIGTDPISVTGLRRRVLYISPEYDMVALLGQDTDFNKLSQLCALFRDADPRKMGISSLALSTGGPASDQYVTTNSDTTFLQDLNQLILFTYGELMPPSGWSARGNGVGKQSLECFRKMGNKCEFVPCQSSNAWYVYKKWRSGKGRQFWENRARVLKVGKNRVRVQDLEFSSGW